MAMLLSLLLLMLCFECLVYVLLRVVSYCGVCGLCRLWRYQTSAVYTLGSVLRLNSLQNKYLHSELQGKSLAVSEKPEYITLSYVPLGNIIIAFFFNFPQGAFESITQRGPRRR